MTQHKHHQPSKEFKRSQIIFINLLIVSLCSISFSSSSNRNQFSIFERNQGPMKAIAAPNPIQQQPPPRMPPQQNWNGQPPMPAPLPPPPGPYVRKPLAFRMIITCRPDIKVSFCYVCLGYAAASRSAANVESTTTNSWYRFTTSSSGQRKFSSTTATRNFCKYTFIIR